jgi:uncharacterized DUF497 family protein
MKVTAAACCIARRYDLLHDRVVVVGYTVRGTRHIFSMRKANDREKARLSPYFKV